MFWLGCGAEKPLRAHSGASSPRSRLCSPDNSPQLWVGLVIWCLRKHSPVKPYEAVRSRTARCQATISFVVFFCRLRGYFQYAFSAFRGIFVARLVSRRFARARDWRHLSPTGALPRWWWGCVVTVTLVLGRAAGRARAGIPSGGDVPAAGGHWLRRGRVRHLWTHRPRGRARGSCEPQRSRVCLLPARPRPRRRAARAGRAGPLPPSSLSPPSVPGRRPV